MQGQARARGMTGVILADGWAENWRCLFPCSSVFDCSPMPQTYRRHGLSFTCPASWDVHEKSEADLVTLSHDQPGTGFWTLTLFFDRPDPAEIAEATQAAFRSEYPELDLYEVQARVGLRRAVGFDIDFLCLETTNSACVRIFVGPRFTGMVLYQGTDPEFAGFAARCERVVRSIRCYRPGSEERRARAGDADEESDEFSDFDEAGESSASDEIDGTDAGEE